MPGIERGSGTTYSERRLAKMADETFLNLWSYPNPYYDKRAHPGGDGKEFCDLLVVCGQHVIIFSEKTIAWPKAEISVAWPRWYKKAIRASAQQLRGAKRWLETYPDRIFLDAKCTKLLPIEIPPAESRVVHTIAVAHGAGAACKDFFGPDRGSLMLFPDVIGDSHFASGAMPFAVGDIDPTSSYVHVLDDVTLGIVMSELDTIKDFTSYLSKKEAFLRSGKLASAHGEEELLGYYLQQLNEDGEHDFVPPIAGGWDCDRVTFEGGFFDALRSHPQYVEKKKADEESHLWDVLIRTFTDPIIEGEPNAIPGGRVISLENREAAVREMTLLNRVERRTVGRMVGVALQQGLENQSRSMTATIPEPDDPSRTVGFFFLCLAKPDGVADDRYRTIRVDLLKAYALTILRKCPHLTKVVGAASEPPDAVPSSEDLMLGEPPEWTPEVLDSLETAQETYGIDRDGSFRQGYFSEQEYPDVPERQRSTPSRDTTVGALKSRKKRKRKQSRKSRRANRK